MCWSVVAKKYMVNSYRIVDNDLSLTINFYSLRRTLIEFYIKSAVYYVCSHARLLKWLLRFQEDANANAEPHLVDTDSCFNANLDSDYDAHLGGPSLKKFTKVYSKWIGVCKEERLKQEEEAKVKKLGHALETESSLELVRILRDNNNNATSSLLVRFCYVLSLACRRALNVACQKSAAGSTSVQSTGHVAPPMLRGSRHRYGRQLSSASNTTGNISFKYFVYCFENSGKYLQK